MASILINLQQALLKYSRAQQVGSPWKSAHVGSPEESQTAENQLFIPGTLNKVFIYLFIYSIRDSREKT